MKIAISQPSYLPWAGFFDLIDQVDQFVLLDDAQFVKQSWHQRNRIKSSAGLQWLTVPVVFRGRLGQSLCDVEIREPDFRQKHLRSLEVNYGRSPYFDRYFPGLSETLTRAAQSGKLVDLNLALIQWLAQELGIHTPMVRSTSLKLEGRRSDHLIAICRHFGATDYISPRSATYLLQDVSLFTSAGISVWFQNYDHPEYSQRFPPFLPYASVLDLLFNAGPESVTILRGGRGAPFAPDQVRVIAETA